MTPREGSALSDNDRRRLRGTVRVLGAGGVLAVVVAAAAGLAGLPGQVGALAVLLVGALACAVGAVQAALLAIVDDLRDHRVARRRPLVAVGLLVAAGLLMAMATGVTAE